MRKKQNIYGTYILFLLLPHKLCKKKKELNIDVSFTQVKQWNLIIMLHFFDMLKGHDIGGPFFFFLLFLASPCGLRDLSSPTRDGTLGPQQWKCQVLTTGSPGNSLGGPGNGCLSRADARLKREDQKGGGRSGEDWLSHRNQVKRWIEECICCLWWKTLCWGEIARKDGEVEDTGGKKMTQVPEEIQVPALTGEEKDRGWTEMRDQG